MPQMTAQTGSLAPAAGVGIFPAGGRQARVDLPALMVEVDAAAFASDSVAAAAAVNAAVTAGATAVILGGGGGGGGAAALYEAAVQLKDLLRGRAALLLLDRTDIASAVDAEGVVLSAAGVPVVVARKMLQGGAALVGQVAPDASAAAAAAADGANFVLLRGARGGLPAAAELDAAKAGQRSGAAIPVIASAEAGGGAAAGAALAERADGFALPLGELAAAAAGVAGGGAPASVEAAVGTLLQALTERRAAAAAAAAGGARGGAAEAIVKAPAAPGAAGGSAAGSTLRRLLSGGREGEVEALIEDERALLQKTLALLEDVVPQMDELGLLRDALAALDDVFLVVVVGEFNSGKSTVINALLGEKFLADGILPTTNEISVLKYLDPADAAAGGDGGGGGELTQERDGLFVRRLAADLLQQMNIVDTPGTNVIVERQQRLTEEFVPRADMVLFVLSADRPLTDSELTFLRYIRQWRKKVVFLVNKVDMLEREEDVQQVLAFVTDNARRLLSLDNPSVLPVSSRAALRAKLECGSAVHSGAMDSLADDLLQDHPAWRASRFGDFERFMYDFLIGGAGQDGGPGGVGEGLRLKLQTPLAVADALVGAAGRQLAAEAAAAEGELAALSAVSAQLARFAADMRRDGAAQRGAVRELVAAAVGRTDKFVDRTLQISNVGAAGAYIFGGPGGPAGLPVARGFDAEVSQGATDQLAALVSEHAAWLGSNCEAQGEYYDGYLAARRRPARRRGGEGSEQQRQGQEGGGSPSPPPRTLSGGGGDAAAAVAAAPGGAMAAAQAAAAAGGAASLAAVSDFDLSAAKVLLEEEVRQAFLGTAGSAAGAQGLGLLAASWIHNSLEDLLALTVAGLASYVSVLNLPLRRSEIKAKVAKIAGNYADTVVAAMEAELEAEVEATRARVLAAAAPLEAAWASEAAALRGSEAARREVAEALGAMERRAANLR
ncbi:MAG: hypothetical protein J3K34DRAFT_517060 [Monoraphidium minutum]|nr:MAG: hypothetical protein J3K34DRAFT_517060 [Monoraphidium minutum]